MGFGGYEGDIKILVLQSEVVDHVGDIVDRAVVDHDYFHLSLRIFLSEDHGKHPAQVGGVVVGVDDYRHGRERYRGDFLRWFGLAYPGAHTVDGQQPRHRGCGHSHAYPYNR